MSTPSLDAATAERGCLHNEGYYSVREKVLAALARTMLLGRQIRHNHEDGVLQGLFLFPVPGKVATLPRALQDGRGKAK
jgi:hypothetical protein